MLFYAAVQCPLGMLHRTEKPLELFPAGHHPFALHKIIEMPLKTKNAYRTLPLSTDAISVLKMQKCKVGNSEWVFPSPTGGPMSPDSVLHMLQRVLKRAGLPRIRFHDLRHTFATMALQNGGDVKPGSSMLGHYSAGFTLDTYAHVTTAAQKEAARTMEKVLTAAI